MSLYTKIIAKNCSITTINTQEYATGTYVIINNDPAIQFGVEESEIDYHTRIRKCAIKNGAKISEESSKLD